MFLTRNKLFFHNGQLTIDIRSYERQKALRRNENIVLEYNGKRMTLTPPQLRNKKRILHKEKVQSKINPQQTYYLLSYLWQPDKESDEEFYKKYII